MTSTVCFVCGTVMLIIPTAAFVTSKKGDRPDRDKVMLLGLLISMWYTASAASHYIGLP